MPKTDPSVALEDYAPVADRIDLFYSRFPEGRITTRLFPRTNVEIVVKAFVYRQSTDTLPAATGLASERVGDGEVNMYACLENTETSAIGRALANLGFAASRKRPSWEEMEKVERGRNAVPYRPPPAKISLRVGQTETRVSPDIQQDILLLMERAEILGFSTRRLAVIRERLARGRVLPVDGWIKVEKALRSWVLRHARSKAHG
jgi:hypothetical protein